MAIDWTKIEGFKEDMTAEEKLQLLENQPEPEEKEQPSKAPDPKSYISKQLYDKLASEFAAVKKELKGRMTDDEQKELERQTKFNEMETELNGLRREKLLANHKASFLALGMDEKMAEAAAVAKADGDSEAEFGFMKQHYAQMEKNLKAQLLKDTPRPPAGDNPPSEEDKQRKMLNEMRKAAGLPPA